MALHSAISTDQLRALVREATLSRRSYRAGVAEHVDGLREFVRTGRNADIVREGGLVYVHGSGHWRPAVVELITRRTSHSAAGGWGQTYTVAHASPSDPDRLYRKRVKLSQLRTDARPVVR